MIKISSQFLSAENHGRNGGDHGSVRSSPWRSLLLVFQSFLVKTDSVHRVQHLFVVSSNMAEDMKGDRYLHQMVKAFPAAAGQATI